MKKIGFVLLLLAIFSTPALACSSSNNITTGAACSISGLNNLEKQSLKKESPMGETMEPKRERNLRPVRYESEIQNLETNKCLFGNCILKSLLGR